MVVRPIFDLVKWPMIGRDADVDHALDLIRGGTGVAILGLAGVGKSKASVRSSIELIRLAWRSSPPSPRSRRARFPLLLLSICSRTARRKTGFKY